MRMGQTKWYQRILYLSRTAESFRLSVPFWSDVSGTPAPTETCCITSAVQWGCWAFDSSLLTNIWSDGVCLMHLHCQSLDQTSTLHRPSVAARRSRIQSLESHEGPLEEILDLSGKATVHTQEEPEQLLIDVAGLQLFYPLDRSKSWLTPTSGP